MDESHQAGVMRRMVVQPPALQQEQIINTLIYMYLYRAGQANPNQFWSVLTLKLYGTGHVSF